MATVRRPVTPPTRASMERPRPGPQQFGSPASAPGRNTQAPDPYGSVPNPNGPPYPWSPGGTSKEVGVPDNWRDFYPTEGHGRGDSWIGPKMELINDREVANPGGPHTFLSVADRRRAEKDPAFAKLHPEALTGNPKDRIIEPQWAPPAPKDKYSPEYHDWLNKYGIWTGGHDEIRPGVYGSEGVGPGAPQGRAAASTPPPGRPASATARPAAASGPGWRATPAPPDPPGWSNGQPPPGWRGGPLTPQGADNPYAQAQQYAGHAQYDPELFAQWKQQHPNDPRAQQYKGTTGLPPELEAKWNAAKGHQLWQQAVFHQSLQPNNGQGPTPAGGLSRTTPGIEGGYDPVWAQRGKDWYARANAQATGQPYGGPPIYNPRNPTGGPGVGGTPATGPTKNPVTGPPVASATGKTAAAKTPATNEQLGKWFSTMKPGATMELQGKKYFKNQNGAVVDITDPRAKKRITDRQGAFIGQAAAPPPPGPTPRPPIGAQPPSPPGGGGSRPLPPTGPPGGGQPIIEPPATPPPAEYPPTNQPPYQYDPYSMNQFAYPQSQGPGPYGWNPGYGGPPFNYSNFGNAIMQGMGGGYGMPQSTLLDYGPGSYSGYGGGGMMPQMQDFMQGFGGGYGWPEQNMGGYGGGYDPYGGMGFDPNMMGQAMMGYY